MKIGKYSFETKEDFINWFNQKEFKEDPEVLWEHLRLYQKSKQGDFSTAIKKDDSGRLVLPEGTLIHGVRGDIDEKTLEAISNEGLLPAAFFKDNVNTAAPFDVCCFEVPKEFTMQEYYDNYNTLVDSKYPGVRYVTNKENGQLEHLKRETAYLPSEPKYGGRSQIAFIITPLTDEETILSERKELDIQWFENSTTIPIGIPTNLISGILVSKDLLQDKNTLAKLMSYFPDKYIVSPNGEIIYEHKKEKNNSLTKIGTIDISEIDLNNSFFHFTVKDNFNSIKQEGLKATIGDASKMKTEEKPRVYMSKGAKGILGIKNSFIHEFKKLKICDIPLEYRKYFDISDYSNTKQVNEIDVYKAMERRFKDEIYFKVDAIEGEDFIIEDFFPEELVSSFRASNDVRDIKGRENHNIEPQKLSLITTDKGNSTLDILEYLYNRLLENAKESGKEDTVRFALQDLDSMFEYIQQRDKSVIIESGEIKEQQHIIEVAGKYGEYLSRVAPQVDDGNNVNYYIVGSLAQMLYANAKSIEYCSVEDGKIIETENRIDISEETREKLSLTGRKIGDLDIIRLNGYDFEHRNWKVINQSFVEQQIPNISIIHNKKQLASIYGDDLRGDLDNSVTNDRVCRLTTVNGETVYVASPETIIAQKLHKVIKDYGTQDEEKKDIKDLVTFVNGIYNCYSEDELAQRVAEAWSEKKDALPVNQRTKPVFKKTFRTVYDNEIQPMAYMGESGNNINVNDVSVLLVKSIKRYMQIRETQPTNTISPETLMNQISLDPKDIEQGQIIQANMKKQIDQNNKKQESVQQ